MIKGYMYPKLGSLLPPQAPANAQNSVEDKRYTGIPGIENHDFTRLEHISARAFMQDEDIARHFLPDTPAKFFKPLLQAAIYRNFYNKEGPGLGSRLKLPGSLVQLILHWPHESFVLKEVIPSLPPPKINRSSLLEDGDVGQLKVINCDCDLQDFYEEIINLLPQEILRSRSDIVSTEEWKYCPRWMKKTYNKHSKCVRQFNSSLKIIDVSGYDLKTYTEGILTPKYLVDIVKAAYNPNCPPGYDKIELKCDAFINAFEIEEYLNTLGTIVEISSQHGAKLTVTFKKVFITSLLPKQLSSLLKILYKHGTECIELSLSNVDDEIANCFSPQLQGLSVLHNNNLISLAFLNNMSNLQQLDLSGMILRNKLAPLCCLPSRLKFLKLVSCRLTREDMKVLEQSHHTKTLVHLDISHNNFLRSLHISELIEFCQVLVAVEILQIEDSYYFAQTSDQLGIFLESLATLPKLSLLCLNETNFPEGYCVPILKYYINVCPKKSHFEMYASPFRYFTGWLDS